MTIKLELARIFVLFSWAGSILAKSIAALNVLSRVIPQDEVERYVFIFAANGVVIGSSPEDKVDHRNKNT